MKENSIENIEEIQEVEHTVEEKAESVEQKEEQVQQDKPKVPIVYLFGSENLVAVPQIVIANMEKLMNDTHGNIEFIVGDGNGIESAFHAVLSRIGARSKTKIYCGGYARNNKWDLPVEVFESDGLIGRELYEARDRQMIHDCDLALCVWDGKSKGTFSNINILKINNKPVYVYTSQY